jgi:hypothetical protein
MWMMMKKKWDTVVRTINQGNQIDENGRQGAIIVCLHALSKYTQRTHKENLPSLPIPLEIKHFFAHTLDTLTSLNK